MRSDLEAIVNIIEPGSRVFDVGCGSGKLLELLRAGGVNGHGLDEAADKVHKAVSRGLSVIQGDADKDLVYYPDKSYDYVVMGKALQATRQPREVLEQLLRIGKVVIISIPNFGNWKNRLYLVLKGRMPVTETLSYQWYETPNIHFCTIRDFLALAEELNADVEKRLALDSAGRARSFSGKSALANLFAEEAIFVLRKNS